MYLAGIQPFANPSDSDLHRYCALARPPGSAPQLKPTTIVRLENSDDRCFAEGVHQSSGIVEEFYEGPHPRRIGCAGRWRLEPLVFLHSFPSGSAESVDTFNLETSSIRAFRDIRVFDDDTSFLAALNEMRDGAELLKTDTWSAPLAPTMKHLTFEFESLHPERFSGPRRLPALTAAWHNQNYVTMSATRMKEIDQELQLHREPFDGFEPPRVCRTLTLSSLMSATPRLKVPPELLFGVVGPIICDALAIALRAVAYEPHTIHLTKEMLREERYKLQRYPVNAPTVKNFYTEVNFKINLRQLPMQGIF